MDRQGEPPKTRSRSRGYRGPMRYYRWDVFWWLTSEARTLLDGVGRAIFREMLDACYYTGSAPAEPLLVAEMAAVGVAEVEARWERIRLYFYLDKHDPKRLRNRFADAQRCAMHAFLKKRKKNEDSAVPDNPNEINHPQGSYNASEFEKFEKRQNKEKNKKKHVPGKSSEINRVENEEILGKIRYQVGTKVVPAKSSAINENKSSSIYYTKNHPPTPLSIKNLTEQLYREHPKKRALQRACEALGEILKASQEPEALFAQILTAHARAAKNPDWLKDGGKYCPKLADWLADRGWTEASADASAAPDPGDLPEWNGFSD